MSDFKAKMHQIPIFRWGSARNPVGGAYSVPPNPLAVFEGPTSKGREKEGGGEEGGRGREGGRKGNGLPPIGESGSASDYDDCGCSRKGGRRKKRCTSTSRCVFWNKWCWRWRIDVENTFHSASPS